MKSKSYKLYEVPESVEPGKITGLKRKLTLFVILDGRNAHPNKGKPEEKT